MNHSTYYCLDIETAPLPEVVQREVMPKEWPLGNLKDPGKIQAAIEEKEKAWLESAALEATRGEVLIIGFAYDQGTTAVIHQGSEKHKLETLLIHATTHSDCLIVGHNLLGFDIPFLCRRMWKHGITPPKHWLDTTPWKATWAFDTMLAWSCGNRDQRISLDMLAWHLGVGRKNGSGADFAKLYATNQEKALEYLRNDLKLTEACYLRMR